ncbi:ABC transporter ATP-binding protein [Sulfitobacter sp. KE29]|uniref:ABC transporter ATP-binding protein n=1 Tax=Sulfitobacter TaxID=60136 RepID=UPI0007C2A88E|nr:MULTISPECIES: ABC transporter ATP-binding protein [Sulfitobacter]KZY51290.1 iron dicitrate ABC transporter ATP-binding protein [Sulfitobacter sp. HI0054]MBO9438194.1 ABC transporter ATP-binding protein [Sulfitobacter sp. R18_2]MDF3382197.1 ABC transporter ATP-binding protein [Sulfitobacter sp. Ks11]MDF3385616.1 ABC transporter ATP-binding protein [Sulfitobacter sp. M85]MDF3389035.1 ABC transporter ATP-binding protein [Sulfitobacter sp. Ks16]
MTHDHRLETRDLGAGYEKRVILEGVTLTVPAGKITAIVGGNASGKSTLLRTLARILQPKSGAVLLDGEAVHQMKSRKLAQVMGLLPQSPIAPEGIAVADLVGRGRHPHQGLFSRWSAEDDRAVARALAATGTEELAERDLDTLSGGQRQRVWIAMALAQETDLLLLDEPTTFLDVAHQVEVLDLLVDLNMAQGTTIVMVLHDLNLAARYADHLIAVGDGGIRAEGPPAEVLTEELVKTVFGLSCRIVNDPVSQTPCMVPIGRHKIGPPRKNAAA